MTLEAFDALIGPWKTEATHPMLDGIVPGRAEFSWLENHAFVVLRTTHERVQVPDAITIIGPPEDGDGLVAEYFDQRGVRRTYGIALHDGVLRWWRDHPAFDQRAQAVVRPDSFILQWQVAQQPGDWRDDLRAAHRRA